MLRLGDQPVQEADLEYPFFAHPPLIANLSVRPEASDPEIVEQAIRVDPDSTRRSPIIIAALLPALQPEL